jgi:hypothetical protein
VKVEDAKKKICPLMSQPLGATSGYDAGMWHARCVGPDCMFWRWDKIQEDYETNSASHGSQDSGSCGAINVSVEVNQ